MPRRVPTIARGGSAVGAPEPPVPAPPLLGVPPNPPLDVPPPPPAEPPTPPEPGEPPESTCVPPADPSAGASLPPQATWISTMNQQRWSGANGVLLLLFMSDQPSPYSTTIVHFPNSSQLLPSSQQSLSLLQVWPGLGRQCKSDRLHQDP